MSGMRTLCLLLLLTSFAGAAERTLEERFIINAQYRGGGINKAFKDLGKGVVKYRDDGAGSFALQIAGTMKNPENAEVYKMRVSGEFKLKGKEIVQVSQKVEMNEEARRYERLIVDNLPFVWLARFQSIPPGPDAEDVHYAYRGHDYRVRYVPLEGTVEGTLFEHQTQVGKFFLEGKGGLPPKTLTKARLNGPDHLVFSLVIDTRPR